MAENNPFAAFDSAPSAAAPAVDDDNPFRQFDSIEPPQPAAPANQPPASITPVQDMPGVSVIDDAEMRDFVDHFSAANQRAGTDKLNESRGRDFMDKLTNFLQYEAELVKGVPSGAVSGVGTGLHGAGALKAGAESNIATFANQQIAVMDRIDAGDLEAAGQLHPSIAGYGQMSAPQREMARERLRRQFYGFTPTPVEQQGLYKAGSALKEHAKTILPAAPGYEEVWTRQIGEGLGSMAIGLPLALVGGGGTAGVLYGAMGAGEASERAIEYDRKEKAAGRPGLTQDDIIKSAIWGVAPGATDVLPVEILLGRLRVPPALAKLGAKTIGRIGGQAFLRMAQQAVVEGSQEGFQQLLQNLIESKYNPEQKLGEDILPNAAVGAGVGGVAQAGKEMAQLALRRFAGRRGSGSPAQPTGQPQAPGGAPQAAAPGAQAPSAGPEAASQAAKAPSSQPEAGIGQIQRDATPQTRMAVREQFNQYLALDERLAAIPDDTDAPPDLTNQAIDAEEVMVASFRATGLPGDGLARGTRPINSMDDVRRAFDEATPEEINEFWQGKAVGPAASGVVVGAGAAAQGGSQAKGSSAPASVTESGPHQVAAVESGGAKIVGDPVAAASIERLMQQSAKRLGAAENAIRVTMKSAQLMEKDVANLRKMHEKAQALRAGFDDRSDFRKSVDNLLFFGDPQAVRNLRADRLEGKRDSTLRTGTQLQRDYELAVRQAEGIIQDLEILKGKRDAALGIAGPRDTTTDFLRLIATPTPRDQWAKTLGVSEDELMPHVERAISSGLLRVDRNGVVRRNAAAVAEVEPEVEAEGQKIEAAIESGAGPLLAPGIIEGENVTLTSKAIDKIQELKAIAEEAVAKILPRDVRIEVVDNIAIDRLAHEDMLLSLRDFFSWPQRTPFQKWFGDSKITDKDGDPLIVYHGTNETGIEIFRPSEIVGEEAIFFTSDPVVSDSYADIRSLSRGGSPTVYPAYLSIKNPYEIKDSDYLSKGGEGGVLDLSQAKAAGYDGYIIRGKGDRLVVAAFRPGQVKSPFNRGAFDPSDPRILYSLRSRKSAKIADGTDEGVESDELPGDSKDAGQAGDGSSQSPGEGAIAAAVGGGGASGADAREGRILRQESATLRSDGSIRTGRLSTAARTAAPGGGDAETLQPVGTSEFFEAPGFRGVVTAMPVADHAGLARRGAPASEYRLANLTYRFYAEDAPLTQAQLRNFQPNFRGNGDFHTPLIWARVSQHMDGTWEVSMVQRIAGAEAPKGMASKLYAAIEQDLGIRMSPSGILSKEGLKMWQKRSPESVKWHQWSKSEGYFISPRRIKDNLARIGMDLADSDPNKAEDHAIAMAERKELIKLWRQLPDDARGATPNTMFSLRTEPEAIEQVRRTTKIIGEDGQPLKLYHGTGQAFDEFDVGKSIEGAVFLASDPSIAKDYDYKGKSPRLIEAYVDIRNPKIIDAQGEEFADAMLGKAPEEGEDRFSISLPERNEKAKSFGDYQIGYSLEVSTPAGHKMEILLGVSEARDLTFRDVTRREVTFDILSEGGDLLRSGETATVFQDEVLEEVLRASASNTMQSPFQGKSLSRLFFKQIINEAKAQGYDGIWLRNGIDMGREPHDQIAAFDSSQVKIVHSAARGPDALATRIGDDGNVQALGQTNPDAKLISIGVRAVEAEARATGKTEKKVTIEVARHEALEFFLAKGFIKPDEWATLTDTARKENWIDAAGVRDPYTAQFGETMDAAQLEDLILKESIMVRYGEYERGNYQPKGVIAKVFKRIKDFLDRLRNSLKSQGFQRWEDIFQKMDAGEMRQRYEARFGKPAEAAQTRVTSKAVPADGRIAAMTLPGLAQNAPLSPAPAGPTPGRAASPPGSLVDIQRNLRRKLGLTVTSGRLDPAAARAAGQAGGKLMGQFDRQTEVIRLRTLQDIDTEAHEVAHALENRYAGLAGLQQAHSAELDGVANLTGQTGLSEGFAEFFRLYLTNPPAADAHAPKFRAAFEDFLETEDAQTLQDIQEIQAQYQQWRDASSAGRITAAVKSGVPEGTWEKIRAEYDRGGLTRVGGMFWAYLEQVYKSRIDRTNPIRVLVERIARHAEASNQDIDLSTWRNPQMQARKISASDGIAYMDITRGVGWENAAGRGQVSLRDALSMAFGGTGYEHWTPQQRDDFGAYLIARRGRWLWQRYDMDPAQNRGRMASPPQAPQNGDWYFDTMARQRRVYLRGRWEGELTRAPDKHSRADHEQAVADLEAANPQFAVAAQMVYQFNRDLALKRHQAGLDSQEEFDYKNGTSDYVPWFRDMTDAIFAGTAASGRKVQGKFKLRGSYRDFINPVEGIIRQVYDTNREVAVNKPKRLLAELADQVKGAGRYAEIIPATRMVAQEVRVREALAQAAKQEGLPPEDAKDMISAVAAMIGDDAVATLFRSEQAGDGRDAILHYMDGGTLKMLQIHDDERGIARDVLGVFEMLRGTPAADSFYSMLTAAVRVPQKAITSSPGFLYRNIIRDTMQASALQVGYFPIVSNIRTVASNRARAQRGEEGWGELLARHGGIMGGIGRTDVRQIKQGRISELRSDTVTLRPWEKQFWKQTINPWHEDFWKWAEWSEANARQTLARISFDRAIADVRTRYPHMKPDQQVFVALESAVQRSRDYTDYARMGDAPSQVVANRLIMFLNPSLQGPDKIIRAALLAQTNEGRFAAVQAIRKKIAPLFSHEALLKDLRGQEKQFKDLTTSEVNGLKDALYVWVAISAIALTHLAIEVAFNDPEDLEDKSQLERATSVSFTINGVDYRIPRGFDIINVMSNAVKASYESWWREDPTAWARFRETLAVSLVPAHSSPILDLYTGWRLGKNNFFSSDIEPTYMKGRLPEDRYSAYTSNLSRRVAGTVNAVSPFEISPLMAEYTMTTIGADWARDILRAYDVLDPNKPALRWQEYPFLRAARGLRGTRGAGDFWDLMGQDGAFTRAGASYREEAVKGKSWSRDDIRKFFEQRLKDEDAKAYSVMLGHYNDEQRRLHPMERAREFARGISGTMRDVASNRIDVPVTSKKEKRVEVSREVRAQALEILSEIGRREYRNALIALKRPGYENREPQPVKPYLAELKTISPEIHKSLIDRITNADGSARVYDYDKVRELWPETRKRLLATDKRERIIETQGEVEFQDLIGKAQGAKALGIR